MDASHDRSILEGLIFRGRGGGYKRRWWDSESRTDSRDSFLDMAKPAHQSTVTCWYSHCKGKRCCFLLKEQQRYNIAVPSFDTSSRHSRSSFIIHLLSMDKLSRPKLISMEGMILNGTSCDVLDNASDTRDTIWANIFVSIFAFTVSS